MLSFLRKHQYGFMLIVAIIVIIAFTFFYSAADGSRTDPEAAPAFEVAGTTYSFRDLRESQNKMILLSQDLGYYDTWQKLTSERIAPGAGGRIQSFAYNLAIFRNEAKKLGIEASDEEVMRDLKSNQRFKSPGGAYDGALFDNFKTNVLPARNMTPDELLDVVRDKIRIDKLTDLLAAGTTASEVSVNERYESENQKIVAYAIPISMEKAQEGLEVSAERIKEHYDKNITDGESLKTEEKRFVEYAFFPDPTVQNPPTTGAGVPFELPPGLQPGLQPTPNPVTPNPITPNPITPNPITPNPTPAPTPSGDAPDTPAADPTGESPAEETGTQEAPSEPEATEESDGCQGEAEVVDAEEETEAEPLVDAPTTNEAPTPTEETTTPPVTTPSVTVPTPEATTPEFPKLLTAEEKRALNAKYKDTMERFLGEVREEGADFATVAKKFVDESNGQDIEVRYFKIEEGFPSSEPPTELMTAPLVMREIFDRDPETAPIFNIRKRYGDDQGFFIVRIIKVEESRDLTLEEATDQIKEALKGDAAIDKIKADLEAAKEKLASAKDGPAFKAAAEELGYEVSRIAYTRIPPTTEGIDASMLRAAVVSTAPGQISEPLFDAEKGGLLVYVAQKTIEEGNDAAERKKNSIAKSIEDREIKAQLFQTWLQNVRKGYDIKVIAELQPSAQP